MPGSIPLNRHSAPVVGFGSAESERLLSGHEVRLGARASLHVPQTQDDLRTGVGHEARPIGKPIQLTLPPRPRGEGEASAVAGAESIAKGMEKVSRAQVDVARRTFWRKCLGVAAATTALVLMAVATGGLGAAGLVSLGLTAAFVAKGSADTVLSLMNWRNLKAGLSGQPPPFNFLTRLPEGVRDNAAAALLVGLGLPEKTSIWVSRALEIGLGLGAVATYGYDVGGVAEAAVSLAPFLMGDRLALVSERMEVRRQIHAQATSSQMNVLAQQTLMSLQDLQALQDRVLAAASTPEASDATEAGTPTSRVDDLIARAQACQDDARSIMLTLKHQWQDRVVQKTTHGSGGVTAEILDGTSESASYTADLLADTSMPFIMVGAMAARAAIEAIRTARSEWRDNDKLQRFADQHQRLQRELAPLRKELRAQLDALESERSAALTVSALTVFQELASPQDHERNDRPPLPGDPRYV